MQRRSTRSNNRRKTNLAAYRAVGGTTAVAMLFVVLAMLTSGVGLAQEIKPANADLADISAHLSSELQTTANDISFLVVLKDQFVIDELTVAGADTAATRETGLSSTYEALTQHAASTQAPLLAWFDEQGIGYRPFYIINMVEVMGDADLAEALRRRPEVDRLIANPRIEQAHTSAAAIPAEPPLPAWLHNFETESPVKAGQSLELPYGLSDTLAVEVWGLGYTGEGIIVASQDTGVEWTHPALKPRYRGWNADDQASQHAYNWYDAWGNVPRPPWCDPNPQVPCDDHGHGTHTVGTMLGNTTDSAPQVGMAPDALWIGCRNMLDGVGTPASYTACFEFFLAPYPQGGDPFEDGDTLQAPHVINNSWGCPPSEGCDAASLRQVVETVRAAGIFVVASAGNEGIYGCGTVNDPIAIYDATFSVGAHDSNGDIAYFSSRGAVTVDDSGRMKPDIAAPGLFIFSSELNGTYGVSSGTSMASPHVAGAAALLWSAVPELIGEIDRTEQALIKGATPVPEAQCGDSAEPKVPNNVFGYGRLNVLAAVELAKRPASLELQVVDQDGLPLANLTIWLTDNLTGYRYKTDTDADGAAVFTSILAGDYQLEILDDTLTLAKTALTAEPDGALEAIYTVTLIHSYLPVIAN